MDGASAALFIAYASEVPRYQLLERLGEGGMGTVYVAEQVGARNRVAVKYLRRTTDCLNLSPK